MQESQSSSNKRSELLRVLNEIGFQTGLLAMDAALERREMAFGATLDEIRRLTGRAARRLAFPGYQTAQAAQAARVTQSLYKLLDRLHVAEESRGPAEAGERQSVSQVVPKDARRP
jgi:hypothetical protein